MEYSFTRSDEWALEKRLVKRNSRDFPRLEKKFVDLVCSSRVFPVSFLLLLSCPFGCFFFDF